MVIVLLYYAMCLFHLVDQVVDRDKMDNIFVYMQRPARGSRIMIHTPTNERKSNFVVTYFGALTSSAEEKRGGQIVA